jgi:hypothetical protein
MKGIWSPNEFFKAYKIKPVISVHLQMVFKFLPALLKYINTTVLKTLLILKIVPKAALNFCYGFPFLQCILMAGFQNNF